MEAGGIPAPEGEMPAPEGDNPFEAEAGLDEPAMPEEGGEPTQELDVTDLVNKADETKQETAELSNKINQALETITNLTQKIEGMEGNVSQMGDAMTKIDAIYKELEMMKPPSPEEAKEIMAQNSYPFNVQLDKYEEEGTPKNQTELEQGKKKLSLSTLLSDFNERDLRQSFNPQDPFDDKLARSLPSYRI